jgi:hypothetical protein
MFRPGRRIYRRSLGDIAERAGEGQQERDPPYGINLARMGSGIYLNPRARPRTRATKDARD